MLDGCQSAPPTLSGHSAEPCYASAGIELSTVRRTSAPALSLALRTGFGVQIHEEASPRTSADFRAHGCASDRQVHLRTEERGDWRRQGSRTDRASRRCAHLADDAGCHLRECTKTPRGRQVRHLADARRALRSLGSLRVPGLRAANQLRCASHRWVDGVLWHLAGHKRAMGRPDRSHNLPRRRSRHLRGRPLELR